MPLPLLALPLLMMAETPPSACTPPPGFEAWSTHGNRPGIGQRFDLAGALAVAGETAEERARDGRAVVVEIDVPRAGRYAIALSDGAWIDLVRNGSPVAAAGHQHGTACSGIRKIVEFDLAPGRQQLRLSGIKAATIGVLIVRR